VAVGTEDGGHVLRGVGREVEVSAEEEAGSSFKGDILDRVAGVAALGVVEWVEGCPAGEGMQGGPFQDALANRGPARFPCPKIRDLLRDPVQFGLPLVRLEMATPTEGGLVFRIGGAAKGGSAEEEGE